MISSRGLTATLFAAALLAFLLPFGTVSCGEPVTFTGLELATSTVHGDDEALVDDIEGQGAFFAILAAISVFAGAGLALVGQRGQGTAALVGLLSLVALPWIAALQPLGSPDFIVRSGYLVSAGSLVVIVGIRAALLVRRRRAAGSRTGWAAAGLCLLFILLLLTFMVCLSASLSFEVS